MSISADSVSSLEIHAPTRGLLFGQKGYSLCVRRSGKFWIDYFAKLSVTQMRDLRSENAKQIFFTDLPKEEQSIPLPVPRNLLLAYRFPKSQEVFWLNNDLAALERAIRNVERVDDATEVLGKSVAAILTLPISLFHAREIFRTSGARTRLPRKSDLQSFLGNDYKVL